MRWLLLIGLVITEAVGLALYENGIPLMLFSPALFWLGCDSTSSIPRRRLIFLACVWWIAPLVSLIVLVISTQWSGAYQSAVFARAGVTQTPLPAFIEQLLESIGHAYYQNFAGGWLEAIQRLSLNPIYVALGVLAGAFCSLLLWLILCREDEAAPPLPRKHVFALLGLGLIVVFLGFVLYLFTHYRDTNFRVFFYSSFGAALCVAACLYDVLRPNGNTRWMQKAAFILLFTVLIGLAMVQALHHFQAYDDQSHDQEQLIARIVEQAHAVKRGMIMVILDTAPYPIYKTWQICGTIDWCVGNALAYVYNDSTIGVIVCALDYFPLGEASDHCTFNKNDFQVSYHFPGAEPIAATYNYAQLAVFENSEESLRVVRDLSLYQPDPPDPSAPPYNPADLITMQGALPARTYSFFVRWPFEQRAPLTKSARLEFDQPPPGTGWAAPENSATWTSATVSTLNFRLAADSAYRLEFRVIGRLIPNSFRSLQVRVNDQLLTLSRQADPIDRAVMTFSSVISQSAVALDPVNTRLEFRVDRVTTPKELGINGDNRALGLLLDWLKIEPLGDAH